jgi:DNA-binding MarR family transcriptional regulator
MLREFESLGGALDILVILHRDGRSWRSELEHELHLSKITCGHTLTRLRELGLIEDEPGKDKDKKSIRFIRLTVDGEKVAEGLTIASYELRLLKESRTES